MTKPNQKPASAAPGPQPDPAEVSPPMSEGGVTLGAALTAGAAPDAPSAPEGSLSAQAAALITQPPGKGKRGQLMAKAEDVGSAIPPKGLASFDEEVAAGKKGKPKPKAKPSALARLTSAAQGATQGLGRAITAAAAKPAHARFAKGGLDFPIMGPRDRALKSVPLTLVESMRAEIEKRFKQPLEVLSKVGGLEAHELCCFLDPKEFRRGRKDPLAKCEAAILGWIEDPKEAK